MNNELDIFYSYKWIENTNKFHFGIIRNAHDFSGDIVELEFYRHKKLWLIWSINTVLTLSRSDIELYEYYFILDQIRMILNLKHIKAVKEFVHYEY